MRKKRLSLHRISLSFLMLIMSGCDVLDWDKITNSGSGSTSTSNSNSKSSPPPPQSHGQVTVNLLERTLFKGQQLDPAAWSDLEAYCKAGPTQLIIADMTLVPVQMSRAGFVARWAAQSYALATTYAGRDWSPSPNDPESQPLWDARDQMNAWWSRYVQAVVQLMKKAPQTTAIIIINDDWDRCGSRLGDATLQDMGSVQSRLTLGNVIR
jgi:hypothetical protein